MNSRSLLDYLSYSDERMEETSTPSEAQNPVGALEARLKDLEARLRAGMQADEAPQQDLTLSAQIEAILKRKAASQPASARHAATPDAETGQPRHPVRVVVEPPPTAPSYPDASGIDPEFLKFTEAVYLIGQAARRFIEQPQPAAPAVAAQRPSAVAPSTVEIEALSAVLRETVSAFRSVADDLAVSAGEIRNLATRDERPVPSRRVASSRRRDDDEDILELRDTVADLQDRLDLLLTARRRGRY